MKRELVTGREIEFNVVQILDTCHEIPRFEGYELEVAIEYTVLCNQLMCQTIRINNIIQDQQ